MFDVADTVKLQKMEPKEFHSRVENRNLSNEGIDDHFFRGLSLDHNYMSLTVDALSREDEIDYENWEDQNDLVD